MVLDVQIGSVARDSQKRGFRGAALATTDASLRHHRAGTDAKTTMTPPVVISATSMTSWCRSRFGDRTIRGARQRGKDGAQGVFAIPTTP